VLGAVRVARPIEKQKGLRRFLLERGQNDARRYIGEPLLLDNIRPARSHLSCISRVAVIFGGRRSVSIVAFWRVERQPGLKKSLRHHRRQGQAGSRPRRIVNNDGRAGWRKPPLDRRDRFQLLDCYRAHFADRCSVIPIVARCGHQRVFIEVIAIVVTGEVRKYCVVLDHGSWSSGRQIEVAGFEHWIAGPNRVAEVTGIAETVPGRNNRGVRHGERRKQAMAVCEIDAMLLYGPQRRSIFGIHRAWAKAVGNEDDHVAPRWRRWILPPFQNGINALNGKGKTKENGYPCASPCMHVPDSRPQV
jgi:hypothetical protein